MAEATEQKMDEIVKKTIDAVKERTERKKAILKNIPSKYILNTYPIDEKAIKKDSDYEFLILESEWSGYKFSRFPGKGEYPYNRFIKIVSPQNSFCFYMRTSNPTTLKPDTKTSEKYTDSLNDLLEITGFNENWIIIPKEYTQDVLEENERVKKNEQAKTSQDIKQELMEKFGQSEQEIAQQVFKKLEEFKNIISADAAIQLILKEHQAKSIPKEKEPDPIAFDFQDEPDINEELEKNCSCGCTSCKSNKHVKCIYECNVELFNPKNKTEKLTTLKTNNNSQALLSLDRPIDEIVQHWKEFRELDKRLLTEDDYQAIGNKLFKKKSAFRKYGLFYQISDKVIKDNSKFLEDGSYYAELWVVAYSSKNPSYQSEAVGIVHSKEKCKDQCITNCNGLKHYNYKIHDVKATAHTRAKNRAISDLVAGGEVSSEEVQN